MLLRCIEELSCECELTVLVRNFRVNFCDNDYPILRIEYRSGHLPDDSEKISK